MLSHPVKFQCKQKLPVSVATGSVNWVIYDPIPLFPLLPQVVLVVQAAASGALDGPMQQLQMMLVVVALLSRRPWLSRQQQKQQQSKPVASNTTKSWRQSSGGGGGEACLICLGVVGVEEVAAMGGVVGLGVGARGSGGCLEAQGPEKWLGRGSSMMLVVACL